MLLPKNSKLFWTMMDFTYNYYNIIFSELISFDDGDVRNES